MPQWEIAELALVKAPAWEIAELKIVGVAGSGAAWEIAELSLVGASYAQPALITDADVVDAGQVLHLTAVGGPGGYAWTVESMTNGAAAPSISGASTANATILIPALLAGSVMVIGMTPTGGTKLTKSITILPASMTINIGGVEVGCWMEINQTPRLVGKSGLPWNSLVFYSGTTPTAFETWRNRPVDGVVYFPARAAWSDLQALPTVRTGDMIVYSIPTFPTGVGASNAAVAAGTYDSQITAWASYLVAQGWNTDQRVIRLGWENNASSWPWSWTSSTYADFVAAYRRWVTVARAAGLTKVRWNWCVNKGPSGSNSSVSWTSGYPGDDVVDVIGLDDYDFFTVTTSDASWSANTTNKNPGLEDVAAFCRTHGKLLSLDEWGLVNVAQSGGGDNPLFIAKMFAWLRVNADILAWESIFDFTSTISLSISGGSAPNSATEYRKVYPAGWGA